MSQPIFSASAPSSARQPPSVLALRAAALCNHIFRFLPRQRLSWLVLAMAPMGVFAQPQTALPGDFLPPFDYLNGALDNEIDLDGNGSIDLVPPCSCGTEPIVPNGTQPNSGFFYDQLIVATGVSGQLWRISLASGVLRRSSLTPYASGTAIPEVGQTGVYVLPIAHRSGQGFEALLESPFLYPGQLFGVTGGTCYYPTPRIDGLASFYCSSDDDVVMVGSATTAFDNHTTNLTPILGFFSIRRMEDGQMYFTDVFSPSSLDGGTYRVRYLFDAGQGAYAAENRTGCIASAEQMVMVRGSNNSLSCRSALNLTFSNSCEAVITPELLLLAPPAQLNFFSVEVFTAAGVSLGDTIPAIYTGQTLTAVLTDECSGLTCNTLLNVLDATPPVLTVPPNITLNCDQSETVANTGMATATDCTPVTITFTDQESLNQCAIPPLVITRTWRAVDQAGLVTTATQTIRINRATPNQLTFPPDVTISCADFLANPNLADPNPAGAGQPSLVDIARCRLAYTHSDDTITVCGATDFVILRTWLVVDICGNTIFTLDGQGNDNMQFIRIADETPPLHTPVPFTVGADLPPDTQGGICRSRGAIPAPIVSDECNEFTIRIFTPVGEAQYPPGLNDGILGGNIPAPGLPPGQHEIVYEATDACGNTAFTTTLVTVVDQLPPIPLCNGMLSLSLPPTGLSRLFPTSIDQGSLDYCCNDQVTFLLKLADEPDSLFREFIDFFCTNDTVTVVMRVTDCNGNFNDCQSTVVVEDRRPVVLVQGPPDVSLSCLDDYSNFLQADFQAPTFADNCTFTVDFAVEEMIDSCGIGQLVRTWTARDNASNPPRVYTQEVALEGVHMYSFTLPADELAVCDEINPADVVITADSGCNSLVVSVVETRFSLPGDDACYRIRRTHRVVNWCEYDGFSPPTVLARVDGVDPGNELGNSFEIRADGVNLYRTIPGFSESLLGASTGLYEYEQLVLVYDTDAPQLADPGPLSFCLPADGSDLCRGRVEVPIVATDNCPDSLTITYGFRLNQLGVAQPDPFGQLVTLQGQLTIQGDYPVGTHALVVTAADNCGNASQRTIPFTVADCTAPQLTCVAAANVYLSETGLYTLGVDELVVTATDNCGQPTVQFAAPVANTSTLTLTCDQLGAFATQLTATDSAGLTQNCMVQLTVLDTIGTCLRTFQLSGQIRKETGDPIPNVDVKLEGPGGFLLNTVTDENGQYAFVDVPEGQGYKLEPRRDDNHDNGVTTFDIIQINRQILAIQPLGTPYRHFAADANRTLSVTTLDVIRIRRVILGLDTVFTGNTSWRFIDERYLFANPDQPLGEPAPEIIILDSLRGDTTFNFIGLKVGDVNNTATPLWEDGVSSRSLPGEPVGLQLDDQQLEPGTVVEVYLTAQTLHTWGGQLSLHWPPDVLDLLTPLPTQAFPTLESFNLNMAASGQLSACWFDSEPMAEPQLALRFRVLRAARLSEVLRLANDPTPGEIYLSNTDTPAPLALDFLPLLPTAEAWIGHPFPNPYTAVVFFPFRLASPERVQLQVTDALGRTVFSREGIMPAGEHRWELDLPTDQGLLFYQWEVAGQRKSGKLNAYF